ncbi:chemotaxis protein CheD [Archaeoglobales archaeon]|nr:MAG: chemotaxis protein CheD [Archaeoglobales archaeon]
MIPLSKNKDDVVYLSVNLRRIKALVSVDVNKNKVTVLSCTKKNQCLYEECFEYCEVAISARNYVTGKTPKAEIKEVGGEVLVGIGEYRVGVGIILKTIGLGSCVGVALYDSHENVGGLAHVMLPGNSSNGNTKYAGTAIEKMLNDMEEMGAKKRRIVAKLAGGAQIFKHMTLDVLKIGDRNIQSIEEKLEDEKIKIVAKDVGGSVGRSIFFNTFDGSVLVRYSNGGEKWL